MPATTADNRTIDYGASEPHAFVRRAVALIGRLSPRLHMPFMQAANFAYRFRFIVADGARGHHSAVVKIVTIDCLSAFAQGGLVLMVSVVANYLDTGKPQSVLGLFEFSLDAGNATVVGLTAVVGLILLFTTFATYHVTVLSRQIARAHNLHCTQQFLQLIQEMPVVVDEPIPYEEDVVLYNLRRNPVQIGIVTERIIMAVQPACRAVVLFGLLFVLDPLVSVVFSAMFVIALPFFYRVAIGINIDTKSYYALLNRYYRKAVDIFYGLYWSVTTKRAAQESIVSLMQDKVTVEFFDANDRFHLSDDRMRLVTGLFKSAFVSLAIMLFGYLAVTEQRSWGELVAYFAGMMMLANSVQTLGGYGALVVRYYPQITEYLDFMKMIQRRVRKSDSHRSGGAALPESIEISINAPKIDGSLNRAAIRKGDVTLLIHAVRPSKLYFDRFVSPLARAASIDPIFWARCKFISARHRFYPVSVDMNLRAGLRDSTTAELLDKMLSLLDIETEIANLPNGLQTAVTDELWSEFSKSLKLAFRLAPLLSVRNDPIIIDYDLFAGIDPKTAGSALTFLDQSYIFLFSSRAVPVDLNIALVAVVEGQSLIGAGNKNWYSTMRSSIGAVFQPGAIIGGDDSHLLES